jgi:ketosteroid isomerase-like protein
MSEQDTARDRAERWRRSFEVLNGGDVEGALSVLGPEPVWDLSPMGLGVYEGLPKVRGFWEEWVGTWGELQVVPEEIVDLGEGVMLAVVVQTGRAAGSSGELQLRYAAVSTWQDGRIVRVANYGDVEEARAAGARLARG